MTPTSHHTEKLILDGSQTQVRKAKENIGKENIGNIFHDFETGKDFLNETQEY